MRTPVELIFALVLALKEGTSASCEQGQGLASFSVSTLQDASDLRDNLMACSGQGTFHVEWEGEINIGDLADDIDDTTGVFTVQRGSSLNVTDSGGGDAVINGGSRVRLFTLDGEGSQLYLNGVSLENGRHGVDGGAVHATDSSLLVATDCSFVNNSAVYRGGEVLCNLSKNGIRTSWRRKSVQTTSNNNNNPYCPAYYVCNGQT